MVRALCVGPARIAAPAVASCGPARPSSQYCSRPSSIAVRQSLAVIIAEDFMEMRVLHAAGLERCACSEQFVTVTVKNNELRLKQFSNVLCF